MGGEADPERPEAAARAADKSPEARLVPFPTPRPDRPAGNVPLALTALIGRDEDVALVERQLAQRRLVTLVGPGGVGKTRLALEIGDRARRAYPDGVWLVDLAPLVDPALVPGTVAAVLDVRDAPGRSVTAALVEALRDRSLLLLFDNCEHLIDASAQLVEALLRACPRVHVLATSREALAIGGEVAWPVLPLATPPDDGDISLEALLALPSVRLFVERAASARPGFALTEHIAASVAQICRRLDGVPLALELAAARAAALTVEEIAARLDDRFQLLTSGSRTAPPRHQALRATLDWSFDLLSEADRAVLRRMAVFVNGWSLAAAERVAGSEGRGARGEEGAPPVEGAINRARTADTPVGAQFIAPANAPRPSPLAPHPSLLDGLGRLVARSLVRFEVSRRQVPEAEVEGRYRMLETVREYAWEHLRAAGEADATLRRHAEWCAELAEEAEPGVLGREQVRWLVRLDDEYANIRAALGWCLEHDPALGLRLAACLWQFWRVRLYLSEGRQWLERLLERVQEPTLARARALVGAGVLANWQLDPSVARDRFEAGLALARGLGDHALTGRALRELAGLTAARFGDHARAWALFAEGIEASRQAGDTRSVATNLMQQGRLAAAEGDYRQAQRLLDESVAMLSTVGDRWQLAITLEEAGGVALIVGQPDRALALFEESVELARALEAAGAGTVHRRYHLGSVAYWRGDAESAIVWYEDGLEITREREHTAGIADNLAGLGRALLLRGDVAEATELLTESLRLSAERDDRSGTARALHGLGQAAWQAGNDALAAARLRESLALRQQMTERLGIAECLDALAWVVAGAAGGAEDASRALRWLGASDALREQLGAPRPPVDRPSYEAAVEAARRWLADPSSEIRAGEQAPLHEIVAEALADGVPAGSLTDGTVAARTEASGSGSTAATKAGAPAGARPFSGGTFPAGLSAREVEVLRLIAAGHTNAEIAGILVVSANTVRHHVTHILDKTGCENRTAAAAFALQHSLV